MVVHEKFIEILEGLLKAKSLSQKELAEKVGMRRPSISDWKTKKTYPYADVALKIAGIFEVSVEYLMTGKDKDSFSQEERTLLFDYRSLTAEKKHYVRALVNSMLSVPGETKKGSKGKTA